uniref:Uncharacterized protein n=1 Tax=Arundo donax TaxID=35708 RepID=A0A0A8ZBC1_ARUDO
MLCGHVFHSTPCSEQRLSVNINCSVPGIF